MNRGAPDQFFSVSEITRLVRDALEAGIGQVWVEGEISNLRTQPSGHRYFTLKDERSQLACVLFFRGKTGLRLPPLADGMKVRAFGALTVYEARGQYQLNVSLVQPAGAGLLQARFEALKRQLEAEGLFDPARKRPLPPVPAALGIVTSPAGAALRDILAVLARRAPWVRVILSPARVQGEGAAEEIAAALGLFARAGELGLPAVDLVIVGRGGGSIEDLWAFNEEIVARAIAASPVPVVSAVGHEIDFTIADFAADVRAATPTHAAQLAVPDALLLGERFREAARRIARGAEGRFSFWKNRLALLAGDHLFAEPERRVREAAQRIDQARDTASRHAARAVGDRRHGLASLAARLAARRPDQVLAGRSAHLSARAAALRERVTRGIERLRHRAERRALQLRALSPEATLERGYSITLDAAGLAVRSAAALAPGDLLRTRFRHGTAVSRVESLPPENVPASGGSAAQG